MTTSAIPSFVPKTIRTSLRESVYPAFTVAADGEGNRISVTGLPCRLDPERDTLVIEWQGGRLEIVGYSSLSRGELL